METNEQENKPCINIVGDKTDLFSHCIAFGLAAILENEGCRAKFWWEDDRTISLEAYDTENREYLNDNKMAKVAAHYANTVIESGWSDKGEGINYSPLGPKVKLDKTGYKEYNDERIKVIDNKMKSDFLAQRMLNLGRPSYWSKEFNDGASKWDMVTTTHGADFFKSNYTKIARGLTKKTFCKENLSKNLIDPDPFDSKKNKFEPVRLHRYGKENTLQICCAMQAFSCFPTRPVVSRTSEISQSNSVGTLTRENKTYFLIPTFNKPVYFERYKSILHSSEFYTAFKKILQGSKMGKCLVNEGSELSFIKEVGIDGVYAFEQLSEKVNKSNSVPYAAEGRLIY